MSIENKTSETLHGQAPLTSFCDYFLVWVKGVLMGAVELIPGVSAGTIALIAGILPRLIQALENINFTAIKLLRNDGLKTVRNYIYGNFLVVLLSGMMSGFGLFGLLLVLVLVIVIVIDKLNTHLQGKAG